MTGNQAIGATPLMPCPFCGGKASLSTVARDWYRITADHVENCPLEEFEIDCPQTDEQLPLLLRDWDTRHAPAALPQAKLAQEDRESLIGYGRSCGLDEASTLCSRLAYAAYYPPGTRFKAFTPKAQKALGDLLIKAANEIASLPGGPYERFKARQAKKTESAKSR